MGSPCPRHPGVIALVLLAWTPACGRLAYEQPFRVAVDGGGDGPTTVADGQVQDGSLADGPVPGDAAAVDGSRDSGIDPDAGSGVDSGPPTSCGTPTSSLCVQGNILLDGTGRFFRYFTAGRNDNVRLDCATGSEAHDYVIRYRTDIEGRYTFRITSDIDAAVALRDSCEGDDLECRTFEAGVTETLTATLTNEDELFLAFEGLNSRCGRFDLSIEAER